MLVFDEFYGFGGWQECEAGAFREFVSDAGIAFEYVARSDFQVAMRLLGIGGRPAWNVRPVTYSSLTPGVSLAKGPTKRDEVLAALAYLRG